MTRRVVSISSVLKRTSSFVMNSAKLPFKILQYFGIWRPKSWTSQWATQLYNIYSLFMVVSLLACVTSLFIYAIQSRKDLECLTESLFQTVFTGSLVCKVFYIFMHRADIIIFDNMFLGIICRPRDICELDIIEKFDNANRWNTKFFLTVSFGVTLAASAKGAMDSSLPVKMWLPYSIDSKLTFWLTYISQMAVLVTVIVLLVAIDCYIVGLMQQICAQLEITKHRLCLINHSHNKNYEKADHFQAELKIKDCMAHHSHVYLAGQQLNNILSSTAFIQFFVTISCLCSLVYQMSISGIHSVSFWISLTTTNNALLEIFLLCWYGEEMIEKSLSIREAIFAADWTNLTPVCKKFLIVMCMRAGKPIQLCGASLVSMCIETFVKILKVSFSVFNVLRCAT